MVKSSTQLLCFILISNQLACWTTAHDTLEHHATSGGDKQARPLVTSDDRSNQIHSPVDDVALSSHGKRQATRRQLEGSLRGRALGPIGSLLGGTVSSNRAAETLQEAQDEADFAEDLDSLDRGEQLAAWLPGASNWQKPMQPLVRERRIHLPGQYPENPSFSTLLPGSKTRQPVPKIFHQIFLDGEAGLEEAMDKAEDSKDRWPTVKRSWRKSCQALHPSWEFRIWNASAMQSLISHRYPWFLETYLSYPRDIHRVDAVRPFILDTFGGVYMDLDIECFRPVEGFLQGHELVFQEEDLGRTSLVNSAIAGAQGLYFWRVWQDVLFTRAPQLRKLVKLSSRQDQDVIAVLNSTGPWALRAAFQTFNGNSSLLRKNYVGAWTVNDTDLMVYPAGSWYVPCFWNDWRCHRTVEKVARDGESMPIWLAGHHKNSGSWFKTVGYSRDTNVLVQLVKDPLVVIVFLAACMYFFHRHWRPGTAQASFMRLD